MMYHNGVKRKHQFRRSATVYKMEDGTEVLKSYDTIVAMRFPDGTFAFSIVWTSVDSSMATKRNISAWCGTPIKAIRDGIKDLWYCTWGDVNSDYLRAIEMATGGRIG